MREALLDFVFAMLKSCNENDRVAEITRLLRELVNDQFDELCVISVALRGRHHA